MWFGHKGSHCLIAVERLKLGVVCFLFCHEQTSLDVEFLACPDCSHFPAQKRKGHQCMDDQKNKRLAARCGKGKRRACLGKGRP